MRTPANIKGHPIHPMLVTIPIGLWVFSFVSDLICMRSAAPETWHTVAYWTLVGGIVGALIAAVPGLIDLLSLKDAAIRKTGLTHMAINLSVVTLYVVNAVLRYRDPQALTVPFTLSLIAILMLLVSGWLGGKMVYLAGVGVSTEGAEAHEQMASRGPEPRKR
ncbi:MAG TPA: DUF2231 domain-containing protein [Albitalea sp.]|nr:DUF2231 domain-containing protein [Albitalea sp.]